MAFIPITERSEKEQRIHKLAYDDGKNNIVNFRWLYPVGSVERAAYEEGYDLGHSEYHDRILK